MLINNIICIKCKPDFTFFSDFLHFIIISFIFAENNLTINISYIIKDVTTIKFKNLNI